MLIVRVTTIITISIGKCSNNKTNHVNVNRDNTCHHTNKDKNSHNNTPRIITISIHIGTTIIKLTINRIMPITITITRLRTITLIKINKKHNEKNSATENNNHNKDNNNTNDKPNSDKE